MAEELIITKTTKKETYNELLPQIEALVTGEPDLIANLANIMAALKATMRFLWVGVYMVKEKTLVLGPFQGTIACTRIQKGKGVVGASWQQKETLIVPNVNTFIGHVACSSVAKSEIVIPILKNNEVAMILDVDSDQLNDFDTIDKNYLEKIARIIEDLI